MYIYIHIHSPYVYTLQHGPALSPLGQKYDKKKYDQNMNKKYDLKYRSYCKI